MTVTTRSMLEGAALMPATAPMTGTPALEQRQVSTRLSIRPTRPILLAATHSRRERRRLPALRPSPYPTPILARPRPVAPPAEASPGSSSSRRRSGSVEVRLDSSSSDDLGRTRRRRSRRRR